MNHFRNVLTQEDWCWDVVTYQWVVFSHHTKTIRRLSVYDGKTNIPQVKRRPRHG